MRAHLRGASQPSALALILTLRLPPWLGHQQQLPGGKEEPQWLQSPRLMGDLPNGRSKSFPGLPEASPDPAPRREWVG